MPHLSISCLGEGLKQVLQHEGRHIEAPAEKAAYDRTLRAIPTCPIGMLIGIEPAPTGRGGRTKRAPSEYNLFMKGCVSGKEKGGQGREFKSCVNEWKASHPKGRS